jgi:hypothetical protein
MFGGLLCALSVLGLKSAGLLGKLALSKGSVAAPAGVPAAAGPLEQPG